MWSIPEPGGHWDEALLEPGQHGFQTNLLPDDRSNMKVWPGCRVSLILTDVLMRHFLWIRLMVRVRDGPSGQYYF